MGIYWPTATNKTLVDFAISRFSRLYLVFRVSCAFAILLPKFPTFRHISGTIARNRFIHPWNEVGKCPRIFTLALYKTFFEWCASQKFNTHEIEIPNINIQVSKVHNFKCITPIDTKISKQFHSAPRSINIGVTIKTQIYSLKPVYG